MSGSASIDLERSLLQHSLAITPMSALGRVYVALCQTAPTETTGGIEASGGGYVRTPATFAMMASPASAASNAATVEFPVATTAWGTLGHFEIWTAATGGTRLYWGPLTDPADGVPIEMDVAAGDIVRFSAGTLFIQAAEATSAGVGPWFPLAGNEIITGPITLASDPATASGAAIQALIDILPANGGMVMLAANTIYTVTAQVLISKPNVRLTAPSWGTVVQRDPAYSSGIVLRSTGAGNVIEGFTVDGNNVVALSQAEVNVSGDGSIVRNMQIINSRATIHLALAGNNSRATGNRIIGPGTDPGQETGYGIWAVNHQTVMIDHNIITGTGIDGIGFDGDGSQVIGNRVSGCHCWNGGPGGQIGSYRPSTGQGTGGIIMGNFIGPGGSAKANGIEAVQDNQLVSGNVIEAVQGYGILVPGNNVTITGNVIHNPAGPLLDAIYVLGDVSGCTITGNKVFDDRATPVMRTCVWILPGGGNRHTIVGNTFSGFTFHAIVDQSTGNIKVIAHNIGNDTTVPSVLAAATVTFPNYPLVVLNGTTTITSLTTQGYGTGRTITLLPSGVVTFTGGAGGIANTITTVANVPVLATFNGTNWYLK